MAPALSFVLVMATRITGVWPSRLDLPVKATPPAISKAAALLENLPESGVRV